MSRADPATESLSRKQEPRTRIRLCGPLELEIDGRATAVPSGQAGSLFRYLLSNRERDVDRDELVDLLWPERPPKDPQADLRAVLSRLRRALAPATLAGRERLRLELPEPVWVDVEAAAHAIESARLAAKSGRWESAREQSETALELLRAGFLPDHDAEWAHARRRELEELELEALEWLARSSLGLGGSDLGAAERASRALIARSPYRETGYRFLMEALAEGGNVAEALRVYEQLRVLLRDELGAAPAAEIKELHKRLLAGEGVRSAPIPKAAGPDGPRRVPLPLLLSPGEGSAFVGRERELDVLLTSWEHARSGNRRLVFVVGEPGIGKTRLLSEFALEARKHGTVLYAGCQEEALISYQPIVEALRHYAQSTGLDWTHFALGPGATELARLIPELADALPPEHARQPDDPDTRRYLLFEAVSLFLSEAAARMPLVLVLDDLHWVDRATVHLLRHIGRAPDETPLLIVGAYREAEIGARHPLFELLADLRRSRQFERVSLAGLDENDVGLLIAAHAGHAASSGLVGMVHDQTEGNPFFVEEVMRHLIETGVLFEREGRWVSARMLDEIGVPEGVSEVLAARLGRLSDDCRVGLLHAAVLGREFSFEVLRSLADVGDDALIRGLEEAVAAQLIVEAQDRSRPVYGFTHALVRETLYASLSGPRRQRLHGRVAAVLEDQHGLEPGQTLVEIAFHLCQAAPGGADAERAVAVAERAAEWELARDAYEQTVALLTRALALVQPEDRDRIRRLTRLRAVAFQRLSHATFDLLPADG